MRLSSSTDALKGLSQNELNNNLEELNALLNEPALKSTARLSILITLALNSKLTFTELLTLTSVGKGSFSNHIEKLESNGLANVRLFSEARDRGPSLKSLRRGGNIQKFSDT